MDYTEILTQIQDSINWIVFALVIASGYFVRATPVFKNYSTTTKLLLISFLTVALYVYFAKIDIGIAISSYFITVGFHSLIVKQIERKLGINFGSNRASIVGTRPDDRNNKSNIVGPRPEDRG